MAIQELHELNKERIRIEEEMERNPKLNNENKKLNSLRKFVDEFDDVIHTVDFAAIFNSYYMYYDTKAQKI